ncbi:2-keto-4-pentenoate hydratase [Amycolatopsis acidicola]|uniref:2-keto-4-pentenoate hydratase n=1 Tax=Amycolatopsis acidicola TaxID=2596893 RepID=A0A5N0UZ36_9PSEU|nr:2-keto-4-pentenoate hydratase [Amycolatopsis acidicola]KAA9155271.1 2-keto-4-pentenoate hydratase [Amycolatopsis acidicola]
MSPQLSPGDRAGAARLLAKAAESGTPIPPLTRTFPGLSVEDAYDVQLRQVAEWTAAGRVVKGHKVGLTSAAIQRQLGVDSPDYGHLFADMFHTGPVPAGSYLSPRVEPEIGFVLRKPLTGPGVTVAEALDAVGYALAALEIIDSRIEDWKITLPDTIADNASSGGVVLGSTPLPLDRIDLRTTGVVLYRNGRIVQTGAGAAVLGSPVNALAWLANTVGPLGITLEAGSVVLPGALTAAVDAAAGDTVTATFAHLGNVTATFAGSPEEN